MPAFALGPTDNKVLKASVLHNAKVLPSGGIVHFWFYNKCWGQAMSLTPLS
jgi:hypothetical protein